MDINEYLSNDIRRIHRYDSQRNPLPQNYFFRNAFFSRENIDDISNQITTRLEGVHPEGKHIIVPDDTIISIMDSVYTNMYRDMEQLKMIVISTIVEQIKNEFEITTQNNKLNIWKATLYSDELGIQQHEVIKVNRKRPTTGIIHLNY